MRIYGQVRGIGSYPLGQDTCALNDKISGITSLWLVPMPDGGVRPVAVAKVQCKSTHTHARLENE